MSRTLEQNATPKSSPDALLDEVSELWTAMFHEPAPRDVGGSALLDLLLKRVGSADYTTIRRYGVISPFARAS